MQNKAFRFGPIALTNTLTTNLLNPPGATAGVNAGSSGQYIILKHLRITNKTGGAATFSLWLGASAGNAAGTEFAGTATSVAANSSVDWYGALRIEPTEYLVGGASANTTLTIQGEGEIGVSG
jgi:energy-converting hydrogenase Eha subunit B